MLTWVILGRVYFRRVLFAAAPFLLLQVVSFLDWGYAAAQDKPKVEVQAQFGHAGAVHAVVFSPDGTMVLSGSGDYTLKLWDVVTGKPMRTFEGHSGPVSSVAFSPTGRTALSGSQDRTLKLWDVGTGKLVRTFEGHSDSVNSVAFSPDGRTVLSGSQDRTLKLWDVGTGKLVRTFEGHSDSVNSVAFSPDGRTVLSGSSDGKLWLWDATKGKLLRSFNLRSNQILSVAFSPDGRTLLSGSSGGKLWLWDLTSGELARKFEGYSERVSSVAFSPDGRTIFTAGGVSIEHKYRPGSVLRFWDVGTGKLTRTLEGNSDDVTSVAFSPDGRTVLSSGWDKTFSLWDVSTGELVRSFKGHLASINSVAFSADSHAVLAGSAGATLQLWDLASGKLVRIFEGHSQSVNSVAFSPDGRTALSGSDDTTLKIWDAATGALLRTLEGHADIQTSVAFSPDGRSVLSGSWDGKLMLWDFATGKLERRFDGHTAIVKSAAFSPDGRYVLSGGADKTLKLWDVATGKLARTLKGHSELVTSVAFSPDGRTVLSGSWDKTLRLWDVDTGKPLRVFEGRKGIVTSFAFSPDGRTVLSGSESDNSLRLWDVDTGKLLHVFENNSNGVLSVAFSTDGHTVLSGNDDGTIRMWNVGSGELLVTMIASGKDDWLSITPAGFFIANSADLVNVVRGLEVYSVTQVYDSLYRPDLVQEALKGDPEGKYKDAASKLNLETILDSGPAPQIKEHIKTELIGDAAKVSVRLTDTGGGIGDKLLWRVNGVPQGAVKTSDAQTTAGDGYRIVSQTLPIDPSRRNVIEITAYNGKGLLASVPYHLEIDKFGETSERPRMFIVAVGVSHYAKTDWSLQYAADDAKAIGDRLQAVAKGLYAEPKVVAILEDAATAKGIGAAIEGIAGDVKPSDVFVLYIAGHGRSIAGAYYFLPQDLTFDNGRTIESAAISQDMLQAWLAKILAQKSILILDTCESASAIRGDVEQETAIDRLQHATGRSIITAASDAAHEGYEGHGLLTGTILDALTKSAAGGGDEVTLRQIADYAYQKVPMISQDVWGERQQPHIRIGDDFPLGDRVAAIVQPNSEEPIPKMPTHVLIRSERVREQPADDAPGAVSLSPGAQVRVVKLVGGFSVIARDGVKLGYVPSGALAKLQ